MQWESSCDDPPDIDEVVSDDVFTTSQELLHVFFLVVGSDGEEHFDLAESLQTCPEDRPLIVQFCANDPDTFLTAVNLALEEIEVGRLIFP